MGNGFGSGFGVMRSYRCSWYGEWDWYRVWSNEKIHVYLICRMDLLQIDE